MRDRTDALFSVCTDRDLHDRGFTVCHFHGNEHLDISLPLTRHSHRTIHLGAEQCRQLGTRLLRFFRTRQLIEPQAQDDFQI